MKQIGLGPTKYELKPFQSATAINEITAHHQRGYGSLLNALRHTRVTAPVLHYKNCWRSEGQSGLVGSFACSTS